VFTNSVGTATTNPATLSIVVVPVVTTQPTNSTVNCGTTATFTAAATGTPTPTVQWQNFSTNAGSFRTDTTTSGNWKGVFGSAGYNIIGNAVSYPAYATVTPSGINVVDNWSGTTTATRALQKAASGSTERTVGVWYSQPNSVGSTFTVNVNLTDSQVHAVSFYLIDWDSTIRSERIDVIDTASGNTIDSQTISGFHDGKYVTWNLSGSVQFKFTNLVANTNAVVSGIFFDSAWSNIPGATSTTYTTPALAVANSGSQYRAVFTNTAGTVTTNPATVTVNKISSTITLASAANPSSFQSPLTFTATVTAGATGTVTFYDGSTLLGTGTISGTTATFSTSTLTIGSHSITSVYGGDINYLTSTSAPVDQTIIAALQVGYVIQGNASSYQVPLDGNVSFSAASLTAGTLPAGLSLSSAGVITGTPAAGTQGNYSLTLNVTPTGGTAYSQDLILTVLANQYVDPNYSVNDGFGSSIVPLAGGNVVVTAPNDDAGGTDAGAVYLFNGVTGALLSTLAGSHAGDHIGNYGVTALTNGNYVVNSPNWSGGIGAVTWGSGTAGVGGVVSSANSLVGTAVYEYIGSSGITALANGNYVVASPHWLGNTGAVTWGSGTAGVSGVVSSANSLVGNVANDYVGGTDVIALPSGNYVVRSLHWSNYAGAVTWGNGMAGTTGVVSSANSLAGSIAGGGDIR